jgi:GNAT superfamily N-acetyltransferase
MTDQLDTSKLVPLDVTGLEPIDDKSKPLDVSALEPLDVSGLEPVDAPPVQPVAVAQPQAEPVSSVFAPAAGSSSQSYPAPTGVAPTQPAVPKTIWNQNDGTFHQKLKPGEPIGIVFNGKKMMATYNPVTNKFVTEIEDKSKPIGKRVVEKPGIFDEMATPSLWNDGVIPPPANRIVTEDVFAKVELDPSQVQAYTEGQGALRSIRNTALRTLPATATSFAAFNAAGIPAAAWAGRVHPYLAPVGLVVGGGLAAMGAGAATELGVNAAFPLDETDELNQLLYPTQNAVTQHAVALAALRPSARTLYGMATGDAAALAAAGKGAAINTALAGQHRLVNEISSDKPFNLAHVFDPAEMKKDAAAGAFLMHKPTLMGKAFEYPGKVVGAKLSPKARPEDATQSTKDVRAANEPLDTSGLEPVAQGNVPPRPFPEGKTKFSELTAEEFKAITDWDAQYGNTHDNTGKPLNRDENTVAINVEIKDKPNAPAANIPPGHVEPMPVERRIAGTEKERFDAMKAYEESRAMWTAKHGKTHNVDGSPKKPVAPEGTIPEGYAPPRPKWTQGMDPEASKKWVDADDAWEAQYQKTHWDDGTPKGPAGQAASERNAAQREEIPTPPPMQSSTPEGTIPSRPILENGPGADLSPEAIAAHQKLLKEWDDKYSATHWSSGIPKAELPKPTNGTDAPVQQDTPGEPRVLSSEERSARTADHNRKLKEIKDRPIPITKEEAIQFAEEDYDAWVSGKAQKLREQAKKENTPDPKEAIKLINEAELIEAARQRLKNLQEAANEDPELMGPIADAAFDHIAKLQQQAREQGERPPAPTGTPRSVEMLDAEAAASKPPSEPVIPEAQESSPEVQLAHLREQRDRLAATQPEPGTTQEAQLKKLNEAVANLEKKVEEDRDFDPAGEQADPRENPKDVAEREAAWREESPADTTEPSKEQVDYETQKNVVSGLEKQLARLDKQKPNKYTDKQKEKVQATLDMERAKLDAMPVPEKQEKKKKDKTNKGSNESQGMDYRAMGGFPEGAEGISKEAQGWDVIGVSYPADGSQPVYKLGKTGEKKPKYLWFEEVFTDRKWENTKGKDDAEKKAKKDKKKNDSRRQSIEDEIEQINEEAASLVEVDPEESERLSNRAAELQDKLDAMDAAEQPQEQQATKPDKSGKEAPVNEPEGFETEIGGIKFRSENIKMLDSEEEATRYTFVKKTSPGKGALIGIDIGTNHITGDLSVRLISDTGRRHSDGTVLELHQSADIVIPEGIKTVDKLFEYLKKGTLTEFGPDWNNKNKPGKDAKAIKKLLDSVSGEGEAGQGAKPKPKVTPPDAGQGLDTKDAPFDYDKVLKTFNIVSDIGEYKPMGGTKAKAEGRIENVIKQLEKIFPDIREASLSEDNLKRMPMPYDTTTREEALAEPDIRAKTILRYLSRKMEPYRDKANAKDQPAGATTQDWVEDPKVKEIELDSSREARLNIRTDYTEAERKKSIEDAIKAEEEHLGRAISADNERRGRKPSAGETPTAEHVRERIKAIKGGMDIWKNDANVRELVAKMVELEKLVVINKNTYGRSKKHENPMARELEIEIYHLSKKLLEKYKYMDVWGSLSAEPTDLSHSLSSFVQAMNEKVGYKLGGTTVKKADYEKWLAGRKDVVEQPESPKTEPAREAVEKDIEEKINDKINEFADEVKKHRKAAAEAKTEQERKNALLRAHVSEGLLKDYSLALEDTKLLKKAGFSLDGDGDVRGNRNKTWIDKSGKFAISHMAGVTRKDSNGYFKILSVENGEVMPFKEIKQFTNSQNDPHSGLRMAISHIESIRGKSQPAGEPAKPPVQEAAQEPAEKKYPIEKLEDALAEKDLKILRRNNTDDFVAEGGVEDNGRQRPTLVVGDTKITLASEGMELVNGKVQIMDGQEKDAAGNVIYNIERIVTAPEGRGKGSASKALAELTEAADKAGLTLQLEPTPFRSIIGKGESLNKQQLIEWYKKNGFEQKTEGSDAILIRKPKTGQATVGRTEPASGTQYGDEVGRKKVKELEKLNDRIDEIDLFEAPEPGGSRGEPEGLTEARRAELMKEVADLREKRAVLEKDISENHKDLWGKKNADVLEHVRRSIKEHNDKFEPTMEWVQSHPAFESLSTAITGRKYNPKNKAQLSLRDGLEFDYSRDAEYNSTPYEYFEPGTSIREIAETLRDKVRIDPYSNPNNGLTGGSMLRQRIAEVRKEMKSGAEGTTLDMRRDPEEDQSGWAKERMDKLFKEWRERHPDASELDFWKEARKRTADQNGGGWFDDIAWRQGVEVNNWPKHKALRDLINQKLDENTRDIGLQKTWTHEDGTKIITDGNRFFAYDKDGNSIGPRDGETSFKSIVHRVVQHGEDIQFREGSGYRAKQKQNEYDRRIDKVRDEITEARRDGNEVLTQLKLKELESLLTESKRWFEGAWEQKEARDQSRIDRKSSYENEKKWTLDETLDSRRDPNNDANDAFDMEERKARELDRRVKQNAENREAGKEEDGGRRGFIGIMDRAVSEARMRGEITDKEVEGLSRIINYIGGQFFDGVKMSIRQGRPGHQGQYDVANRIVTIFKEAIQRGRFEDTAGHEVGHHLEQFLPEGDRAALRAEWLAARKKFTDKWSVFGRLVEGSDNWAKVKISKEAYAEAAADFPTLDRFVSPARNKKGEITHYEVRPTDEMYRLFTPREWFAETFKEAAREKLNNDPAYTGEQPGWKQKIAGVWNSIKTAFAQVFGKEQAKRILANFAKGRYKPEDADPSVYSEPKMSSKKDVEEATRLTPEERDAIDQAREVDRNLARGEKPELTAGGKVWRSVVDHPVVAWFKPLSMRMRTIADLNPQSEALQKVVNDFSLIPGKEAEAPDYNTDSANMRNVFFNKLTKAFGPVLEDMRKMGPAELKEFNSLFIKCVEGRAPRQVGGRVGEAIKEVGVVLAEMQKYGIDAGLKLGKVEGFFPRSVDANAVDADKAGFVRAATKAYEVQFERLKQEAKDEAAKNGTEYVEAETPDFDLMARKWRDAILLGREGLDFEHGIFEEPRQGTKESFQKKREFTKDEALLFDAYRDKDVERTVINYVGGLVRKAEVSRRIGVDNGAWGKIKSEMDKQGVDPKDIAEIEQLIKSNIGIGGKRMGEETQQALDFTKLISNAAYLKLTGLLNITEAASIGVRTESASDSVKAVWQMFRRTGNIVGRLTPEQTTNARNEIERIYGKGHDLASALAIEFGINTIDRGFGTIASGYHLDGGSDYQGKLNKASDGVYRMYGIHATEAAKREISLRIGADFIDTNIKWLEGTHNLQRIARAMGKEAKADNLAKDRLKELGLKDEDLAEFSAWVKEMRKGNETQQLQAIMSGDPMAAKYRQALIIFNKQSSVQASRSSRTESANDTALGRMFFQFSTFTNEWSAQHGRRMQEQSRKIVGDNKYNATERMLMAGVGPAFAVATAATYGIRTIINMLTGFEFKDGDKVPAWVKSMADAFVYTGMLGPAEILWKAISRGQLPAGVVGDWAKKAWTAGAAMIENPDSNAAQRAVASVGYRSAFVPAANAGLALATEMAPMPVKVVAGLAAQAVANNRTEKAVADLFAGEKQERGSSQTPEPTSPPKPRPPSR